MFPNQTRKQPDLKQTKYSDIRIHCGGIYLHNLPLSRYHTRDFYDVSNVCTLVLSSDVQQASNRVQIALRFRQLYERPRCYSFATPEGSYHTRFNFNVRSDKIFNFTTGRRFYWLGCSSTGFLTDMVKIRLCFHFYDSIRYDMTDEPQPPFDDSPHKLTKKRLNDK